jgi:UDP-N-acetylmuramyl pentapeptide phosphotransferase/UDP-N-acetylglucosamine-1-phosphate transferase
MAGLLFFIEAFILSYLLTGAILRFSLHRRLFDVPNDRSSHSIPKPRLGGVAITAAFYVSAATLLALGWRPLSSGAAVAGAFAGGAVIALVGFLDDLRGLDARLKLLAQVAAAAIAVASGIVLREFKLPLVGTLDLGAFAAPATVLWIVAIVNFYNFIDGIDGLAAGVGMIASSFLYFLAGLAGAASFQSLYAVLAGSSFGFLRFNFPPARIFMGDMGSTFIGYTFAVLAVAGEGLGIPAFLTILLLASAIGDAALTLARRALRRERLLSPHRTHYYQRLTSLGLSHKQVTLLEYLVTILLGVSAVLAYHQEWTFVVFLSVMWIGFFLWTLAKIRSMEQGKRLFWAGRALGVAFGDLAFIALSYVLSYWLRLNFRFPEAETASMLRSLPIVLVIRTAVFFWYGLYRNVWRYTNFDDVVRIVKAVAVGSVIMVVSFTLLFRFQSFPRSAFIIDWFILTVFMAGSRIAARWFHELPAREEIAGRRVIIAGTGPAAELVLAEIKRAGGIDPIGCLDDRVEMTGRVAHGLTVLGTLAGADAAARAHRADEIVAAAAFFDRIPRGVLSALERDGIPVRVVEDPAEFSAAVSGEDEGPFALRRILVAGNGSLVERAGAVFAGASSLAIASDDPRSLDACARFGAGGIPRDGCHLGVLGDRQALLGVFDRCDPEIVIADLTVREAAVANPLEAYLRIVRVPLERIAAESVRRGARLVAVLRDADRVEAVDAAETVLRGVFRGDPGRLTVVRIDREPRSAEWRGLLRSLADRGGVFRAVREGTPEGALLPRPLAREAAPDVNGPYRSLLRSLDGGGGPALERSLGEIARAVGEHVS